MSSKKRRTSKLISVDSYALPLVTLAACLLMACGVSGRTVHQGVAGDGGAPSEAGPEAGTCRLNSDCLSGSTCIFQVCGPPCAGDTDCNSGFRCLATGNGKACVSSSAATCAAGCPEGTTCDTNSDVCRNACDTSACLNGQSCSDGLCVGTPQHENGALQGDAGMDAGGTGGTAGVGPSGGAGAKANSGGSSGVGGSNVCVWDQTNWDGCVWQ